MKGRYYRYTILLVSLFFCEYANAVFINGVFRSKPDRSFVGLIAVPGASNGYFNGNGAYTGIVVVTPNEFKTPIPVNNSVNAVNFVSANNYVVLNMVGRKYGATFELPISLTYESVNLWAPEGKRWNPIGNCSFDAVNKGDNTLLTNTPNGAIKTDCTSYTIGFNKPNSGTIPVNDTRHLFSWGDRPLADILYEKRLPADEYNGSGIIHTTRIQLLNGLVPVNVQDVNFEFSFKYTNDTYIQEISIPSNQVNFNVVPLDDSGGFQGKAQVMATVSGFFGSGLRVTPKVGNSPVGSLVNVSNVSDLIHYNASVTSNISGEKYQIIDGENGRLSPATFKTINQYDQYDMSLLFDFSFQTRKNNSVDTRYHDAVTLVFESDVL